MAAANLDQKRQRLLDLLAGYLPDDCIVTDVQALRAWECDAYTTLRQLPLLAVLPTEVSQVQHLMRSCALLEIPVVARGSGTGLTSGAMPVEGGVLLVMTRFSRILEIDTDNRCARVEPGVTNLSISEASAPFNLFYAPDPSSQLACSIGGNVAENAGGIHCLKYGLTVNNVQAIDLVSWDGELLTIGGASLDTPGYDLAALLTGSEGLLGVIVEVRVKLLPRPAVTRVMLAAFRTIENAGNAVAAIIAAGVIPAGLEMIDHVGINAIEEMMQAGYPTDAAAILICELDGSEAEVSDELVTVRKVLEQLDAYSIEVAENPADQQRIWAARKAAFPAMARMAPDNYILDGTIPRRALASSWHAINRMAEEAGLQLINVFHAGDGNMHPSILFDASIPGEHDKATRLASRIMALCVEVGGSISGEHGIGLEKINEMCLQFGSAELEQFHALKIAFDPKGLLNPGRHIPTLARCAEFNAMHVHNGEMPFPELERF